MRPVLAVSLALASVAVMAAAYPFLPGTPSGKAKPAVPPLISADPTPYRVIPLDSGGKVVPAPKAPRTAPAVEAPQASAEAAASVSEPPKTPAPAPDQPAPDVLASVARTLEQMKAPEGTPPTREATLTPAQRESLRQVAIRRKVRPVTKLSFPLTAGTMIPQAVFLHPVPPDVAALSPGGAGLGFAQVGDRFVVVANDTRKIVAVSGE